MKERGFGLADDGPVPHGARGDGRQDGADRPRRGGDRGHHQLHQHLEPLGDARGGDPGEEGGRARPDGGSPRQDQPGPRLQGGDGVPPAVRASCRTSRRWASTWSATAARPASATAGRCRRPVHRAVHGGQAGGLGGALRQPELRGAHQPRREGQLPGLPAAGGGLRAGRHHRQGPPRRSRWATDRQGAARRTSPTSGRPRRRSRTLEAIIDEKMFAETYANVFDGNPTWNRVQVPEGDLYAVPGGLHLHPGPAVLPGPDAGRHAARGHPGGAPAGHPGRLRDHRPHLPRGGHRGEQPRRALPEVAGRGQEGLQLLRRAARQRPGDGAGDVREHPPQEPHGARAWRGA